MAWLGGGSRGAVLVSGSRLAAGGDAGGICPAGGIAMKKLKSSFWGFRPAIAAFVVASSQAQNLTDVLKQGEQAFAKSCATAYCHGIGGGPSAAPRLAAPGVHHAYINKTGTPDAPHTRLA